MRNKNVLKILFIIRAAEHFSRYDSIVQSLCLRGHRLVMLFDKEWTRDNDIKKLENFKKEFPNLDYYWLINRKDWRGSILFIARSLLTYRLYLTVIGQSNFFRDRWPRYMPFWLRIPVSFPFATSILKTKFVNQILRRIEEIIPPDKKILHQIQEYNPDVLVSPVVGIRVMSPNTEYLKAAVALKIPTVSPTISWDSLTTKSMITVFPDIFLLWNKFHKKQIIEHHNAPSERIRIIGASVFDKWFSIFKPSCARSEFCSQHGLKADKPYILYLGSARGTAGDETWLIAELRKELDNSSDPILQQLQIVVRPHPANAKIYEKFSIPNVTIVPKGGALPNTAESLQLSYDTYYHAAAVVGIFTSAMMEAQIVDRPVIIVLSEKYKKTQLETRHFQDFIKSNSLELANGFKEFRIKLKRILTGYDDRKEQRRLFVKNYIRPQGLEKSAGELAAEEIEKLCKKV